MRFSVFGRRWGALVAAALAVLVLAAGCQQAEQTKEGKPGADRTAQMPQSMLDALHGKRPEGGPAPPAPTTGPMHPDMSPSAAPMGMPRVPSKVEVPDEVKRAWKAIVVEVSETGGPPKDYKVPVPGELVIPGSGLTLKVASFLPDFKMTPEGITSLSNELNNPAAQVEVLENGKSVFKGWLFKLYPDAHPFQHPKYRVILKDWVAS